MDDIETSLDKICDTEGGSAFPWKYEGDEFVSFSSGLTKREYFAAHAPYTMDDAVNALMLIGVGKATGSEIQGMLVMLRVQYADQMLAALDPKADES